MRDRRVFESWRKNTRWGRLFTEYRRQGALRSGTRTEQPAVSEA